MGSSTAGVIAWGGLRAQGYPMRMSWLRVGSCLSGLQGGELTKTPVSELWIESWPWQWAAH